MEQEIENPNSLNGEIENVNSENDESLQASPENDAEVLKAKNKQLFERAKKAEAEAKELREFKAKAENKPSEDLGKQAFYLAKGIEHNEDIEFIEKEAQVTGKPLTEILKFNYVTERLQANKEIREAKAGMPHGSERSGGSSQGTVEYWLAKGGLPNDQALSEKVVNARMQRETGKKFADEMF